MYAALNSMNSSMLPACFVLKLSKKMPMCMELVRLIQKVTELECTDVSSPQPLLSLIVQHASDGQLDSRNNKGLYVVSINNEIKIKKLNHSILNYFYWCKSFFHNF